MVDSSEHFGICEECDKRRYLSRRAAQVVVHRLDQEGVIAYRCPHHRRYWHVGHLVLPILKGAA